MTLEIKRKEVKVLYEVGPKDPKSTDAYVLRSLQNPFQFDKNPTENKSER